MWTRQFTGSQPNQVQVMKSGRLERWTCQDFGVAGVSGVEEVTEEESEGVCKKYGSRVNIS